MEKDAIRGLNLPNQNSLEELNMKAASNNLFGCPFEFDIDQLPTEEDFLDALMT